MPPWFCAAHEVALVGAFVELLGDREEHFDGAFGIGFRKPDIPEREYESLLSGFEESAPAPSERSLSFLESECADIF